MNNPFVTVLHSEWFVLFYCYTEEWYPKRIHVIHWHWSGSNIRIHGSPNTWKWRALPCWMIINCMVLQTGSIVSHTVMHAHVERRRWSTLACPNQFYHAPWISGQLCVAQEWSVFTKPTKRSYLSEGGLKEMSLVAWFLTQKYGFCEILFAEFFSVRIA